MSQLEKILTAKEAERATLQHETERLGTDVKDRDAIIAALAQQLDDSKTPSKSQRVTRHRQGGDDDDLSLRSQVRNLAFNKLQSPRASFSSSLCSQSATLATSPKPESSRNYVGLVKALASLARQSEPPPMPSPFPQKALHFCHLEAQSQSREKMCGG